MERPSVLPAGGFLPDRIINLALQYLTTALTGSNTYKMMRPLLDDIVFQIAFPQLCHNAADQELWDTDPNEVVRKGYDIIEEMYSPRTAAVNFIVELCRCRSKENLPKVMGFMMQIFARCAEATRANGPAATPHPELGAALHAIGSLQDKLKSTTGYKEQIEPMLMAHVAPCFASPFPHVRAKACWCAGVYAEIEFQNPANFLALFGGVVAALKDDQLPVKVDATTALGSFVEAAEDIEQLKPILPQLLDEFFKLMNEVESEDLVFTLETIVEKFGEDIAPYALGLAQNLAAAFWKLTNSQDDKDDDDMNGALACVGCLRAIATILESISTLPHLYGQIEPTLMPILRKMLTQEGYDVYEEILEICSYITYYSPTVTPAMWELWPIMFDALESWGIQYFENVLVPLDNYISRGTEHFLAAPRYRDDVLRLCGTVILANEFPEPECIPAPKLMECVLQNCRGRVDDVVPGYLAVALERLPRCKGKYLKDLLIQVVANCLYYDAPLTLRTLEKNGKTNDALSAWFAMLSARTPNGKRKHHKREHDKKVCALGLTALLRAPAEAMPPAVAQGLGSITSVLVALLDDLKTQMTERKEMEENGYRGHGFWGGGDTDDEGEYVDEDLGDGGDDDPEDEKEPLDEEALRALAMKARKFGHFDPRGGDDDDDDDDSDDDGMLTDDECVTSPMDDVDAFVAFEETMRGASAGDPGRFNAMTGGMDQAQQGLLNAMIAHAEVRRREIAEEKAEKAEEAANKAAKGGGAS